MVAVGHAGQRRAGSPWLPVVMIDHLARRAAWAARRSADHAVGHAQVAPLAAPCATLFIMLRPTTHDLALVATAASITCCTREISEANVATMTRPSGVAEDAVERLADHLLRRRVARRSRRRWSRRAAPARPRAELGQLREVGQLAVHRRVVELEVAGVHDGADGRVDGDADRVRDAVATLEELDPEGAQVHAVAGLDRR